MDYPLWIDRLYTDESLTDNLSDSQAEQLLAWGERELTRCLSEEEAVALIAELRRVNHRAGKGEPFEQLLAALAHPDGTGEDTPSNSPRRS